MPKSYFFSTAADSQPLATVLQRNVLTFLSPQDLSAVAETSPALNRLLTQSEPTPSMELHANLQVFRERRGILNGYKDLQQSTLPDWLKQRWSTKPNMLKAISQAVISLERDDYIPKSQQHTSVDFALALTEAWPKLIINIYCNDRVVVLSPPIIDTISLHALLSTHSLQLLLNGRVINNKDLAVAALELTEVFLNGDCQVTMLEGLQALFEDLCVNGPLIRSWLSDNNMVRFRNHTLAIEQSEYFANLQDDDSTEEENAALIKKLAGYLTNPHLLLMLRENHLTIEQLMSIDDEVLITCLASRHGLVALRQKYLILELIEGWLKESFFDETVLTILTCLLSDSSFHLLKAMREDSFIAIEQVLALDNAPLVAHLATYNGLIALEQKYLNIALINSWLGMMPQKLALSLVACLLTDVSLRAFADGLIRFDEDNADAFNGFSACHINSNLSEVEQITVQEAWLCRAMGRVLTLDVAGTVMATLGVNSLYYSSFSRWQELLTDLSAQLIVEKAQPSAPRP